MYKFNETIKFKDIIYGGKILNFTQKQTITVNDALINFIERDNIKIVIYLIGNRLGQPLYVYETTDGLFDIADLKMMVTYHEYIPSIDEIALTNDSIYNIVKEYGEYEHLLTFEDIINYQLNLNKSEINKIDGILDKFNYYFDGYLSMNKSIAIDRLHTNHFATETVISIGSDENNQKNVFYVNHSTITRKERKKGIEIFSNINFKKTHLDIQNLSTLYSPNKKRHSIFSTLMMFINPDNLLFKYDLDIQALEKNNPHHTYNTICHKIIIYQYLRVLEMLCAYKYLLNEYNRTIINNSQLILDKYGGRKIDNYLEIYRHGEVAYNNLINRETDTDMRCYKYIIRINDNHKSHFVRFKNNDKFEIYKSDYIYIAEGCDKKWNIFPSSKNIDIIDREDIYDQATKLDEKEKLKTNYLDRFTKYFKENKEIFVNLVKNKFPNEYIDI